VMLSLVVVVNVRTQPGLTHSALVMIKNRT